MGEVVPIRQINVLSGHVILPLIAFTPRAQDVIAQWHDLRPPWDDSKVREVMCAHVVSFRVALCQWDVIFRHLLIDDPAFRKVNPAGVGAAGSADGCLQPCPFCKSNLNVEPDASHRFDSRMVSGAQGNVLLVYARYQCSAAGCLGERPKERKYTTFASHDARVVAALPAALTLVMLNPSRCSCWPALH